MAVKQEVGAFEVAYPQFIEEHGMELLRLDSGEPWKDDNTWYKREEVVSVTHGIETAPYIDDWHRATLSSVFGTNRNLGNRQRLADEAIVLLDEIRTLVVPGQPFLVSPYKGQGGRRSFTAGHVNKGTVIKRRSDIQIDLKGTKLDVDPENSYPQFSTDEDGLRSYGLPGRLEGDDPLSTYRSIARRTGSLSFGADNIRDTIGNTHPRDKFYAAVTAGLAGIETGPVELGEEVRTKTARALIAACAESASGINASDNGVESVVKSYGSDRGYWLRHNNGLRDRSIREMRTALNVTGIDAEMLESGMNAFVEEMIGNSGATIARLGSAIRGRAAVGAFVERMYQA